MTDLQALRAELDAGHPVTGAYSLDAATAADEINVVNRTTNRTSMSASEVLNAVVVSEYVALTDAHEAAFWNLMGIGDLNPFGVESTLLISWFGAGSETITALAALRKTDVSRAQELGFGIIYAGTVLEARAL